jgi:RIO-like serine/threonine protein kinase
MKLGLLNKVKAAFDAFERIHIIHIDAKVTNLFVKVPNGQVSVKFIDWDDCFEFDAPILDFLRRNWTVRDIDNSRIAPIAYHEYFYDELRNLINAQEMVMRNVRKRSRDSTRRNRRPVRDC